MKLRTVGVAPKAIAAGAIPLVAGIVLLLVDKLVAGADIDDTLWWTLIASSPLIGGGTAAAPAAPVRTVPVDRGEAGQSLVELVIAILVILILVFLLLRLV